ncbi:hypothetical protein QFZ56_000503 [Streptomyces achromogenes]|uniref:Uncharacterized protein n=1 Tax=Streptomyces achromogenes TaxID=67255 RepID=A0ABU0PV47_STRAH|nr:hypothetical protein [Streptomyces achromogenes]
MAFAGPLERRYGVRPGGAQLAQQPSGLLGRPPGRVELLLTPPAPLGELVLLP